MKLNSPRSILPIFVLLTFWNPVNSEMNASADSDGGIRPTNSGSLKDGLESLNDAGRLQILRLLDSMQFAFTAIKGKAWNRHKGTYIVALTNSMIERGPTHEVFAFDISQAKYKVMATAEDAFTFAVDDSIVGFDFASYRLNANEFAFGIRYSRHRLYATDEASLRGVLFCRIQSSKLLEIANVPTFYDVNLRGDENEDGTQNRIIASDSAVLIVTNKKTAGYFDWIKKCQFGKSVRLAWKGNGYVLKGADPFPTQYQIFEPAWE
jgi:hypothetical protein